MPVKTFRIKQKVWFWDADFWIQDERGNNAYKLCNRSLFHSGLALKDKDGQELIIVRKPLFSLKKDCYQISACPRNSSSLSSSTDTTTATATTATSAEIKEKRVWFESKHVLILDQVEYVVDASKWSSHTMFSIQNKGFTIAHVHKKRTDRSQSLWLEVDASDDQPEVDGNQQDGVVCLTVVAACLVMIQILLKQDRRTKLRLKREALDNMPLQTISSKGSRTA